MANSSVIITISAKDLASAVFKQIGVEVKAGADKAVKGLEKYQEGLEKTGKAATKLGKGLSIGVTAPLAAFGAIAVNSAVKADRLTQTLTGLAGGADKAASFIDAIKSASLGTIPQIQALEIANSALSFGVVETEEGMASLVETAIVLGKAQGLDAATAVGDLTTALARQSPMILDNLGITLKMSEASQIAAENAAAFGFEADNLTKAQEFQIAAMVKGREAAAKMGGMQEDMATKVERAKAQVSDMATTLGASLIPMLETVLDVVTPVITGFANMDPATQKLVVGLAAVAAGAGPVLGAFGSITTAAGGLIGATKEAGGAMSMLKNSMTGTQGTMIAVTAAAIALAGVYKAVVEVGDELVAGQQEVNSTLDAWPDKAAEAVAAGGNISDVMLDIAAKANDADAALHADGNALADFGTALVRSTSEGKTWTKVRENAADAAVSESKTYAEYEQAVLSYNDAVTNSSAQLSVLTEKTFNASKANEAFFETGDQSNMILQQRTESEWNALLGIEATTDATIKANEEAARTSDAQQQNLRNVDMLSTSQERATSRAEQMGAAVAMSGEQIGATGDAVEAHRARVEKVNAVTAMQAESATRQAAALEVSRLAAIGAAEAQVMLAGSLKDATDAQIASALIEQLDPEALGAAAFAEGVTTIQTAFGLADEKSIALAQNLGPLSDAMNDGIIPVENYDEALAALIADAADGEVNTGLLLDQFARAPGLIGPSADKLENLNEKLVLTGEDAAVGEKGMTDFGAAATGIIADVDGLTGSVVKLNDELGKVVLPGVSSGGGGGASAAPLSGPGFQFGGTVPGPIGGAPRLVVAEPGEQFTPPSQIGGPTNNFGGNTQTVIINDAAALGFFEEQQRQERLSRLSVNL